MGHFIFQFPCDKMEDEEDNTCLMEVLEIRLICVFKVLRRSLTYLQCSVRIRHHFSEIPIPTAPIGRSPRLYG